MIGLALSVLGFLKGLPRWVYALGGGVALALLLWHIHAGWKKAAYNDAYNAGWRIEHANHLVTRASLDRALGIIEAKNAETEARAKALADAKVEIARNDARFDEMQRADRSRVETLQRLAKDLPDQPGCRVPAALSAQLEGL